MAGKKRKPTLTRTEFLRIVGETTRSLPAEFRSRLEEVAVVVRDRPTAEDLREAEVPEDDTLFGVFQGTSLPDRTFMDGPSEPNRIVLFRKTLEESFPGRTGLIREIRKTLLHELGHYLGMSEEDLEKLGYE